MKKIAAFCIVLSMLNVCYSQKKQYTFSDIIYKEVEYTEIKFIVDKKTNDTLLIQGLLKKKAIIDEIPCQGNVTLTKEGKLKKFTLAEAREFAGYFFPADTRIEMEIDLGCRKEINSLRYFTTIRGAENRINNLCFFPAKQIIDGILCNGEAGVFFRSEDWSLLGCILAEADTIKGNVFPEGTFIRFDNKARIGCFCPVNVEIQGYACSGTDYTHWAYGGGGGIYLYRSGRLKYFRPVEDVVIQGVWCSLSSVRGEISLYENGNLKQCTSAKDQTINGVLCEKKFTLKFDENGKLVFAQKEKFFD